jgi:ribosomal protein S17
MKTTLNLDDRVLRRAKKLAAAEGITLTAWVGDALRARTAPRLSGLKRFRLVLPTVRGDAPPRIDIADRKALFDVFDDLP